MDFTDPYFSVQDDILKNIGNIKNAYERLLRLNDYNSGEAKEASDQLRQSMKSVEWDMEDLQDTMELIENKPSRFRLSEADVIARRRFLSDVRNLIKSLKANLSEPNSRPSSKEPINFTIVGAPSPTKPNSVKTNDFKSNDEFQNSWSPTPPSKPATSTGSSQVNNPRTRPKRVTYSQKPSAQSNMLDEQKQLLHEQDERLDQLGTSISTLKTMSHKIGNELGDQIILLDDFSEEMAHTESRLDTVTKRAARLLHLNTNRQQWTAIAVLSVVLFVIILLLIIL